LNKFDPARAMITDEALNELLAAKGVETELPQYNTHASEDAIRHYALGIGDDNPLYLDPDYGPTSARGGMVAPPTFVMTCGFPRSRGLAGIHGLFSGVDLHCHKPLKLGTRIKATTTLHDLVEHQGRYSGRSFEQIYETKYLDENGELLSTLYTMAFRTERKAGGSRGKYADLERASYTPEQIAEIGEVYRQEVVRRQGATPLYFEDVNVGDRLRGLQKGPLTVTDMICFLMGFGYIYVRAHRQWYSFIDRHPGAGVTDTFGVPDVPERVHWDEALAQEIGMPTMYDYGPQRIGWFDHTLSDWMGDHGWLRRLKAKLTAPNFVGDVTRTVGEIVARDETDNSVVVELSAIDQRGRTTATASAEVVLPSRIDDVGART